MGIVNGLSIVNNLIAGSMTGAQLQTYLATGSNLASFVQVTNVRRQLQVLRNTPAAVTAVTASSTALALIGNNETALRIWALYGTSYNWRSFAGLTAVLASAPAMAEVAASPTAMAPIIASSTAMTAAAASATAMTAIAASTTAKMAMFADDVALAAIAGSSTALTALRGAAGYAVSSAVSSTSAQALPGATAGASYILLGVSCSSAGGITITSITTRRSGSARPITASVPATGTDATKTTMCTPLVSPFNWTSNTTGQTWYFGLLRCDV